MNRAAAAANILIVDDTPANLRLLVGLLTAQGYKARPAPGGQHALDVAQQAGIDLILLDITMPGMDGYDVCRRLKAQETTRDIPVIFLSALNDTFDKVQAFQVGGVDYITKPFQAEEVLARVSTHLQLREAQTLLQQHAEMLEQAVQERTRELLLTNQVFARFVPFELLKILGKNSIVDVRLGDQIHGEMTILFSDIRDYTTMSEQMTPQEVFNFTNGYHSRMTPVIRAHHGFVQQFQGDGTVAVFPGGADDAIQAAIGIQQHVQAYNREREAKGRQPIRIGIGLHTGPLMIGIIGDDERWESGVPSDTVNTAARMESLTKFYQCSILMSDATLKRVTQPERYHFRFLDRVQAKGKADVNEVYEVYESDPEPDRALKIRTQATFEAGQRHYIAKAFADAIACFQYVLAEHPVDQTTQFLLERAMRYLATGVPDGWQGIERRTSK